MIVGMGDSTTSGAPGFRSPLEVPPDGRGNPESQYAHWMSRAHPEWTVLNRGVDGERSDEILARFSRDVLAEHPDYAIILAGVNDIKGGRTPGDVQRNLGIMYAEAMNDDITPVAATVLPYNTASPRDAAAIWTLNDWIKLVGTTLGIPVCDTHAAVADPRDASRLRGSPDDRHPDVEGYRRMGDALVRTIEEHVRFRGNRP